MNQPTKNLKRFLYEADLGSSCALDFTNHVRDFLRKKPDAKFDAITNCLRQHALEILEAPSRAMSKEPAKGEPKVILIVGVNGSGKTTSIAKLAKKFLEENKTVLLGAADTFEPPPQISSLFGLSA